MTPEEWPIAASAAPLNAPACQPGRGRLSTVRADFFLEPAQRLTEQERALMTAMLHCLLGDIADQLQSLLPVGSVPANEAGNSGLVDQLSRAGLLDEPELIALLLRRAEEERAAGTAAQRGGAGGSRILQSLVSHDDAAVSAAAMGLILARARRRDRFGQCLLHLDDLSRALADRLVHAVAAVLRFDAARTSGKSSADTSLSSAARQMLEAHNPRRSEAALIDELVARLNLASPIGMDDLLLAAASEGETGLVAALLAARAGLVADCAAEALLSGSPTSVAALCRLARLPRTSAAGLLAGASEALGLADPAYTIGLFDSMTDSEVEASRSWLSCAPAYRIAVAALEGSDGQRAL